MPGDRNHKLEWRYVAMACLFLAGKVEDNPKKLGDLVAAFHGHWSKLNSTQSGPWSEQRKNELKNAILVYERLILIDSEFDMIVEAPVATNQVADLFRVVDDLEKRSIDEPDLVGGKTGENVGATLKNVKDIGDLSKLVQDMFRFANGLVKESLYTTLWLQYDPPTIALGLVYLTAKVFNYGGRPGWWRHVQRAFREKNTRRNADNEVIHTVAVPSSDVLDDIGKQLVEHYSARHNPASPYFPPLPDRTTGEVPSKGTAPSQWRSVQVSAGKSKQRSRKGRDMPAQSAEADEPPGVLTRDGETLSCTCLAWRALEDVGIPPHDRTCRCLIAFCGWKSVRATPATSRAAPRATEQRPPGRAGG